MGSHCTSWSLQHCDTSWRSHCCYWELRSSWELTSGSVSREEGTSHRFMPSARPLASPLWPTTKSMWMKPVRRRSRTSSRSTIVPSSSPTRGDASPKSLVDREQEQDTRSRTVRLRTSFALHTVYHDGIVMLLHVLI